MKKVLLLLVLLNLSGCAYERSYEKYANAQVEMAKAMGPMMKQTFDETGRLTGQEFGNQTLVAAMLMMGKPSSEIVEVMKQITGMAPWAAIGWIGQAGFNQAGSNTSTSGSYNTTITNTRTDTVSTITVP